MMSKAPNGFKRKYTKRGSNIFTFKDYTYNLDTYEGICSLTDTIDSLGAIEDTGNLCGLLYALVKYTTEK